MKVEIKKIDRVPFSVLAKPDTGCPFYVGYGKEGNKKSYKRHQRYCIAKKVVAIFFVLDQHYVLTGCCCKFGTHLPGLKKKKLFKLAEIKKLNWKRKVLKKRGGGF